MRALIALLTLAALAGCAASTERVWVKPHATEQDFYADRGFCQAQTYSVPNASAFQLVAVFQGCMQGKGWLQEERRLR